MRVHAVRLVFGLLVVATALAHLGGGLRFAPIEWLDRSLYDGFAAVSAQSAPHPRVIVVEIGRDRAWHRGRVAEIVERLVDRQRVATVVLAEPLEPTDPSGALPLLERLAGAELRDDTRFLAALGALRPELDHDARLASALAGRPVVLAFELSRDSTASSSGVLPAGEPAGGALDPADYRAYRGNPERFQAIAARSGFANLEADADGVVRRARLRARLGTERYTALAVAALGTEGGASADPIVFVPARTPGAGVRRLDAEELLADRLPEGALAGRVVLLTDPARGQAVPSALVAAHPIVEIHAALAAGLLDRSLKREDPADIGWAMALLGLAGLALAIALPRLGLRRQVLGCVALALAALAASAFCWHYRASVLGAGAALFTAFGLLLVNLGYRAALEYWRTRRLTALYGEYVPAERLRRMARQADADLYGPSGRNEVLSVLFADLRNFTRMAEDMAPESVRRFLVDYLTEMSRVVHDHHGTVDKYMGDSVMAFWGAPLPDPKHAAHAVRAAFAMQAVAARFANGRGGIAIGIGVNSGLVSVGDMGSKLRRTYTAIGDPVNLASRLESLTKYYGVGIIIGESTRELVPDVICREIDLVKVKGRDEVVAIYEPLGFQGTVDSARLEALELWNQMIVSYRHRHWDEAEAGLAQLEQREPESRLVELYAARVARCRRDPPPMNWDAVMVFDRK